MDDLKPCPFCNGKAEMEILPHYEGFFVKCLKCKVEQGHLYRSKKSATIAWNRRKDNEQIREFGL